MSIKWTGSETGILRKSEFKEKKEELFVFGYSCKLFREDEKALYIDQGKHLIPWMGDDTLKIDRYDARGALHELASHEAPAGGFDVRMELTKLELEVEQMCDEERYRALHTDEDEELMYKEEELKRLHAAGYGQVGFNYDAPTESPDQPAEVDEPFEPTPEFKAMLPADTVFPETQKQNAIIEKTSKFVANQGTQMEILIKAKQRDNPQFRFMDKEDGLHRYYVSLVALVKAGKWPEEKVEVVEEKPPPEPEEYLHPSLAATVIESAPSIPSLQYRPSADCDYSLLVCELRGEPASSERELPPPGTEIYSAPVMYRAGAPKPPVQSAQQTYQQYAAYYQQYLAQSAQTAKAEAPAKLDPRPVKSTGLSLMKHYDSASDSEGSDSEDSTKPQIIEPPNDIKLVIEKMAAYVARNGDEFADIVRAKNDPRFIFLEPNNEYHAYYEKLMREKRGGDVNGVEKASKAPVSFSIKKLKEPDPILPKPALPYESSSDDESENQTDKQTDKQEPTPENPETTVEKPAETPPVTVKMSAVIVKPPTVNVKPVSNVKLTTDDGQSQSAKVEKVLPPILPKNIPTAVVYKLEGPITQIMPTVTNIEPVIPQKAFATIPVQLEVKRTEIIPEQAIEKVKVTEKVNKNDIKVVEPKKVLEDVKKDPSPVKEKDKPERDRDSPHRRDKKRHKEKREYSKSDREKTKDKDHRRKDHKQKERDRERYDREEKERERKRRKVEKEELVSEVISLEDNSDELIDLTGDLSDSKGEVESEADKAKQTERRRRAAEFLKRVGVDPAAVSLPTNSLASAMVDTLESIRKKKQAEDEKKRRREKRRRRDRRDYADDPDRSHRKSKRRKYKSSDDEESDVDGSKKKKRKKEKKQSKTKKRKREEEVIEKETNTLPNIDIISTVKELRTHSPTKELLPELEIEIEEGRKKKGERREYSEGEWSSDSDDSMSSSSRDE